MGRNALAIFTLSLLAVLMMLWIKIPDAAGKPRSLYSTIYRTVFAHTADPRLGSLLFALAFLAIFVALAGWMNRRRIYIKL
jgi:predicted acyltransferase